MTADELRKSINHVRWLECLGKVANERDYNELLLAMAEGMADLLKACEVQNILAAEAAEEETQ